MSRQEQRLRKLIAKTRGHFFRVDFIKSDGAHRRMVARTGVRKNLTGKGLAYDPAKRKIQIVYDVRKRGYKAIRLDRVMSLKCGRMEYNHQ